MEKKYPFKFLDSYNQNDTDMFFGRDEEIVALYEMVFQNSILLVYGASGTGKTSLIQCGLAGRFKSYDWLSLTIRRGTNINAALEKALIDTGGDDLDEEETLSKDSSKKLSRLLQLIKGVYLNSFKPIYLIFDQFEELYILGTKDEQEKFIDSVKEILKAEQPVKMIFSIREEYLGHLFEFEKEVPQLLRKKLRVEPMTLNKVTDVIKGINSFTLSNVRIKADEIEAITQGIFERLRGKKKTLTIQLPYLQVFLDKLYLETTKDETRKADALIELGVLNRIGDIGDVLRNFLEEQVAGISQKLSQDNKNVTPEIIWKILSPFSTLEGTKEPISKKELGERLKDIDKKLIDEAVESFVNSRILNFSESANLYELAHDSLALRIAEKRSDEEISLLEVRRLIKSQVSLKQDAQELFSKKQLNFIEPHLNKLNLSEQENQLIAQSKDAVHKAETKYKARRRRILITITAITAVVIASLSYFLLQASIAKNKNKLLLANNYWNNSKSEKAATDYIYALANAAEAVANTDDEGLTKKILIDIEHHWPAVILNNMIADQGQISLATYGSSDSTVITIGKDLTIKEWNAFTGKQIREIPLEVKTRAALREEASEQEIIGFTSDGQKIITTDTNNLFHISFVKNGKEDKSILELPHRNYNRNYPPAFNRDGSKVIFLDPDRIDSLYFFDLNTGSSKRINIKVDYHEDIYYYYNQKLSSLALNRSGTKFLYLINDTSLYIGDTKTMAITKLLPEHSVQPTQPQLENTTNSEPAVNANNGKPHSLAFNRVSFTAEENILISAGKDSTVRFWNSINGKQVGMALKTKAPVQFAFLIPSTKRIFTRDEEGSTYIWDNATRRLLGNCVKLGSPTQRVKFRNDGNQLLVVENNTIFIWDLLQKNYGAGNELTDDDLPNAVYSSDLTKIVIPDDTFKDSLGFQLLNAVTRSKIGEDMKVRKKFSEDQITSLLHGERVFSPDNKKLLIQIGDSTMILLDIEKQMQVGDQNIPCRYMPGGFEDEGRKNYFSIPIFSPDSKTIAAFGNDSTVQFFNAETGRLIGKKIRLTKPNDPIFGQIIFGPDSTMVLIHEIYVETNNEGPNSDEIDVIRSSAQLWNILTGELVGKEIINDLYRGKNWLLSKDISGFDPEFGFKGKTFITFSNSYFQIWDSKTGKQIGINIDFQSRWPPFYSLNKKYILAAVNNSTIQYFDAASGNRTATIIKHAPTTEFPIISPDTKSIIIFPTEKNKSIQLFNTETGKEVKENADYKHQDSEVLPCFSPDGALFLTDQSGFIRLWESKTGNQKGPAMKYKSTRIVGMVISPDGKKILTKVVDENIETTSMSNSAVIWDAETWKQIGEEISIANYESIGSSKDGDLIAIENQSEEGTIAITRLISIEAGDLDIPDKLFKLQVSLVSGYKIDLATNEKIPLTPGEFTDIRTKYNQLAPAHYKNCKYAKYNFWKRFHEEEANKEDEWKKKKYTADQFTILSEFQLPDKPGEVNNGSFLKPNQAITSKNGQYLLAYQRDGNLVIYKREGMEQIWSSQTSGTQPYRTIMQFDGNLVIYSADPGTTLGNKAIWSSDTWRNNRGARLVLGDDGNLVIYNTKNKVVWQSNAMAGPSE